MSRAAGALLVVIALALAGCGDDDSASTQTIREESPALPTATATATATGTPPTATAPSAPSPPPDASGPPEAEGDAGDEEPARTPVRVVVDREGITPARTEVPAFLGLRITVRNTRSRPVTVALRGAHRSRRVAGGAEFSFDVDGLTPGEYTLDGGDAGRATIVAVRPAAE